MSTTNPKDLSLEHALVERAWRDAAFARLLERSPREALALLGVETSPDVALDIRCQRRDTLYYVIPPLATNEDDADRVINQMDLWRSADLFCWVMPQALKIELLRMRQSYRRNRT
jgi:hypothetical protein